MADEVKHGGNIIDSFFTALGFEVDTKGLEEYAVAAEGLRANVLALGTVLTAAAVGIGMFAIETAESLGKLQHFAELQKLNVLEVAAWNRVAASYHVSNESMMSSLEGLNQKLGEAAIGLGRGKMVFQKLGLQARDSRGHVKSLNDILDDVSQKMSKMSRPEQLAAARRLGITPDLVMLLGQGKEKMRALREEAEKLNPITQKQYEEAEEVDKLWIKAKMTMGLFAKMIGAQLLPIVKQALTAYLDWFKVLRASTNGTMTTAFKMFAAALGTVWDWIVRVLKVGYEVVHWLGQFKLLVWLAVAAVSALVSYKIGAFMFQLAGATLKAAKALFTFDIAAALPAIAIGALVLAIGLLIDELYNYYKGNKTVIGQLMKDFPYAIKVAWTALTLLIGGLVALKWTALTSLGETMAIVAMYAAEWIVAHAAMAVATLAAYWPVLLVIAALIAVVAAVWYVYKNWDKVTAMLGKAWDWVADKVDKLIEKIKAAAQLTLGFLKDVSGYTLFKDMLSMAKNAYEGPAPAVAGAPSMAGVLGRAAGSSLVTSHSESVKIHAPITIVTPDPHLAGEAVSKELGRKHRDATRNGQSAVAL